MLTTFINSFLLFFILTSKHGRSEFHQNWMITQIGQKKQIAFIVHAKHERGRYAFLKQGRQNATIQIGDAFRMNLRHGFEDSNTVQLLKTNLIHRFICKKKKKELYNFGTMLFILVEQYVVSSGNPKFGQLINKLFLIVSLSNFILSQCELYPKEIRFLLGTVDCFSSSYPFL